MTRGRAVAIMLVALAVGGYAFWPGSDEREIKRALASLAADFNDETTFDGLGGVSRAGQLGSYFSEDAVVDLGPGSAQVEGRDKVISVAARLQPRTAAFRVALDDVGVEPAGDDQADVTLTVSFINRTSTAHEPSTDAREFLLRMTKGGGRWRIARATAVDTFRK